jgi:hypothetical protein
VHQKPAQKGIIWDRIPHFSRRKIAAIIAEFLAKR